MWLTKAFIIFLVSVSISNLTIAQQDTVKADTTQLYKNIEAYSKGSKLKTFMYHMFFRPVTVKRGKANVKKKGYQKLVQKPYNTFEGKIIRYIDIFTLDPFGYSATDTTVVPQYFLSSAGNKLHIRTQSITIRNLLLVHKNDPFSSVRVRESERLIRNQSYVHDVFFYVSPAGRKSDSVDIFIRVLDRWSIIPSGSLSASKLKINIDEKNFLGTGHESKNFFSRNASTGISSFNTIYFIPNIRNTFINSTLHFGVDGNKNSIRSFAIDRPFFSPLAKWAGGLLIASENKSDSLKDINSVFIPINLKFKTQDYWAANAIRIFKDNPEMELITNVIVAVRYLHIRYLERPSAIIDPLHIFSSENFYFTTLGISSRKYVQDKYIFKYGVIEDVPVGNVYELTGGYQVKNNSGRFYFGIRYSRGSYNKWGYLSSNFEYGTFFHSSHTEQGVISAGINYFTPFIAIGKWKFRQFVKPEVIIGLNRFSYDSLTLNDGYGLDGFYSSSLSGTRRILLTLQTQSYAPWNLIGFHFGPYLVWSMGMVGKTVSGFKDSKMYSQLGLGVLIKNENLIFNTFQISIAFYPLIPGRGQNVFKGNSFRTTDFGFRDFVIGKPASTIYQ